MSVTSATLQATKHATKFVGMNTGIIVNVSMIQSNIQDGSFQIRSSTLSKNVVIAPLLPLPLASGVGFRSTSMQRKSQNGNAKLARAIQNSILE